MTLTQPSRSTNVDSGSMKRNDLKVLAQVRLSEAGTLLSDGKYAGAYYLAGYVVECALKACIAKQTERYEFPNKERASQSWSHSLTGLAQIAGLQRSLADESDADPQFGAYWGVVKDWKPDARYISRGQKEAEEIVRAIVDSRHGVLRWLKRHW